MATVKKGKQGGPTSSIEKSPERRKRDAKRRTRQEDRWASKSGPVTTRKVDPEEFLVRPDEVARLRKAAQDAGMDDEEFNEQLATARKRLRETGKLELPPKLKAAVDKKKATPTWRSRPVAGS